MNSDSAARMAADAALQKAANELFVRSCEYRYSYNFSWMGRPIIQYPQDMVAMQEIIWSVRPDLVIETGIAHGGSLVYYASLLELLGNDGIVVGIDIDIRPHNREAIEAHPMARRIRMIEGSSIDPGTVAQVAELVRHRTRVLVTLDSNHTHDHVLQELLLYSPFVSVGSYLTVFDTVVEDMPKALFPDRPWGPGNNPKTAVREFLGQTDRFVVDKEVENKLLLTVAPDGYLRCVKT
jgi:cephalosporin hydroxylase